MIIKIIKEKITDKIKNSKVYIESNDNVHFKAVIVSNIFDDKKIIERQRIINDILSEYIRSGQVHAISFKTYTEAEWNQENK